MGNISYIKLPDCVWVLVWEGQFDPRADEFTFFHRYIGQDDDYFHEKATVDRQSLFWAFEKSGHTLKPGPPESIVLQMFDRVESDIDIEYDVPGVDDVRKVWPTWHCKLGPWQKTFEEGEEDIVCDWAQQLTLHYISWPDGRTEISGAISDLIKNGGGELEVFGRTMTISVPKRGACEERAVLLPTFYKLSALGEWDATEIAPIKEHGGYADVVEEDGDWDYWSVYVHYHRGGRDCVADVATKEQAESFATLLTSSAASFAGYKKHAQRR